MRIQFTVSQSEWNTLKMKSIEEGYPDVPSYCKDIVLKQRTYAMLWNTVTKKIESMPSGERFLLKVDRYSAVKFGGKVVCSPERIRN